MTDHEIAKYLKAQGALGNYRSYGNSTFWFNPTGDAVLVIVYCNETSSKLSVKTLNKDSI